MNKKSASNRLSNLHDKTHNRSNQTSFNHREIEKVWQKKWEENKLYYASDASDKKKFYQLIEFPYPSGDGLHVGHPRPYIGMDVISRKKVRKRSIANIIAEIEVSNPEELGTFVINSIRSRNDVRLTSSLIVAAK